jgi:anti-anti-sigma regulatory factor
MLKVKIDTKEIFHVICIEETVLTANMAEKLDELVAKLQTDDEKSLVIDLKNVEQIDISVPENFIKLHNKTYGKSKSLVFCNVNAAVKQVIEAKTEPEALNITPTESEAWDIVQMEEIERELDMDI